MVDSRFWMHSPRTLIPRSRFAPKRFRAWPTMQRPIAMGCSLWRPVSSERCGMKLSGVCEEFRLRKVSNPQLRTSSRGDPEGLELVDFLVNWGTPADSPPDRKPPQASDIDAWVAELSGPADTAAGERVFFHAKGPGCYRCHQIQGRGSRAGPDLTTLSGGIDRRRLIESIVSPSKEIAPQFVAYSVARSDGTVFSGILLEQSPEGELIFADSQGRRIPVKSGDIAERKPQTISIMPAELPRAMTKQEMRDLLAFLLRGK